MRSRCCCSFRYRVSDSRVGSSGPIVSAGGSRMWNHMPNYKSPPSPGWHRQGSSRRGRRGPGSLRRIENSFELQFETFDWGSDYYRRHGEMMPADGTATLRGFDAIYFGAVGAPDIPDHITYGDCGWPSASLRSVANVRPARLLPGIESPCGTSCAGPRLGHRAGEFRRRILGHGGRSHRGLPGKPPRTWPSTHARPSAASCGSPSTWLVPGRAAILAW